MRCGRSTEDRLMLACLWRFDVRDSRTRRAVAKSSPQRDRALGCRSATWRVERSACVDWAEAARTRSAHRQAAEDRKQLVRGQAGPVLGRSAPTGEALVAYRADKIYTLNDINRFEGPWRSHPQFGEKSGCAPRCGAFGQCFPEN